MWGDMEVEALGTAFNVKAYEEDDEVVTTLFEGSVRTAVGKEFVILSPDESAVFNKSSHILSVNHPTNASYARLWRTNEPGLLWRVVGGDRSIVESNV